MHTRAHTHTLEYYAAVKRAEQTLAPTQMDLENVRLSERLQLPKATGRAAPLGAMARAGAATETESGGGGRG